jgi:hypothetical protein
LAQAKANGQDSVDQLDHKVVIRNSEELDGSMAGVPGNGVKGFRGPLVAINQVLASIG